VVCCAWWQGGGPGGNPETGADLDDLAPQVLVVESAPNASAHGHRSHAGGQRQGASKRLSTVGSLLTLALLLVPLASEAQLPRSIPRIAYLALARGPSDAVSRERSEALAHGLRDLGYVEGKTIILQYGWSAGNVERLRENAAELVRHGVHVIVTQRSVATRAVKDMSRTIPIVMAGDTEPVGDGFVASPGRPGGNIPGVTTLHRDLSGKRLELLKDTVPGMARVAVLYNPVEVGAVRQLRDTEDGGTVARSSSVAQCKLGGGSAPAAERERSAPSVDWLEGSPCLYKLKDFRWTCLSRC
jgi:hypothetical protein